ncbi:MAG: hypothetical protein DMG43_05950 [Acidobacteria bacterium]|nr:MAG: hypothetical protein DMG43_05950 [Acidobacteriota bacterium]
MEVLILKDLGVNIIMEISVRVRARSHAPGWFTQICALKRKSGRQAAAFQMQVFLRQEYCKKDDSSRKKMGNA